MEENQDRPPTAMDGDMSQNPNKSQLADEDKPVLGSNPLLNRTGLSVHIQEDDAKSEASEIEEELTPEEDFRLCGKQI
jgi:hypothetical protein